MWEGPRAERSNEEGGSFYDQLRAAGRRDPKLDAV